VVGRSHIAHGPVPKRVSRQRGACGGKLKIFTEIEDLVAFAKILVHPGLPARAPSRALIETV
jgi:hypothetical protein